MKKQMSLILVLILVLSLLAACGTGTSKEETSGGTTGSAAASTTEAKPEEPVEVTYMLMVESDFQTDNNPVALEFEKATNVRLKFEIAPESAYLERVQIMLASGATLPNLFYMPNNQAVMHKNGIEQGAVVALDDYLKNAPNIMKYTDPNSWPSMKLMGDGKIYGLPKATQNRQDGFFVRKDWLDKFGITLPENEVITMDTLLDIMDKFTNGDPDGNGKKDTYGLSVAPGENSLETINNLNGTFGILGWQKAQSGSYEYMHAKWDKTTNNFKDALAFCAKIWKDGTVDPNWPNNKSGLMRTRLNQGIVGIAAGSPGGLLTQEKLTKANFPNAEIGYIARVIQKEGDKPTGVGFGNGAWGCVVITKTALKDNKMDAIFKLLEWQLSDEGWNIVFNGLEGRDYKVVDGKKVFDIAASEKYVQNDKTPFCIMRRYNDNRYSIGPAHMNDAEAERLFKTVTPTTENLVIGLDRGYEVKAAKEQVYIDYKKVVEETMAKIIIGDLPVSAWDSCLDGWYKNGGEEFVKEMNEYIKSQSAN